MGHTAFESGIFSYLWILIQNNEKDLEQYKP